MRSENLLCTSIIRHTLNRTRSLINNLSLSSYCRKTRERGVAAVVSVKGQAKDVHSTAANKEEHLPSNPSRSH